MANKTSFYVPAGYKLTIVSDQFSDGYYFETSPGKPPGTPVAIGTTDIDIVGPFNEDKQYILISVRGSIEHYIEFDYIQDDGGSSTLAGLTDVTLTDPIEDDILVYDGTKWINNPNTPGGPIDLDELSDVTIVTPSNGQVLTYQDGIWVNEDATGGGGSSTLAGLSDVDLTSPVTGDFLVFDGVDWSNISLADLGLVTQSDIGTMAAENAADYTPTSGYAAVSFTGSYSDLTGTPTLATVATTGAYNDLTGKPTLGTMAAETATDYLTKAGNLSGLANTATARTNLGVPSGSGTVSGTNTGDQTITLTGDVTGTGTGSFATAIGNNKVTLAMMAQMATASFLGRTTASTGNVEVLSASQAKTVLSLNNVENTALSTWAGSTNITTLGTIGTGTWNATAIGPTKGGTGLTTYTAGDILYASASNTLSVLAKGAAGKFFRMGASLPDWSSVPFSISNGGASSGVSCGALPGLFTNTTSNSQTASVASTLNTKVLFIPFMVGDNMLVSQIQVGIVTGAAASTITAGIYAGTTSGTYKNFPGGAPLAVGQGNSTTSGSTLAITLGSSIQLEEAKLYYIGIQCSTATTLSIATCKTSFGTATFLLAGSGTWTQLHFTYTNTYSAGSLPTLTNTSIGATQLTDLPLLNMQI